MKVGSRNIKLKTLILTGAIITVVIVIVSSVLSGLQDAYMQDVLSYRKQKNENFKTSKDSPIEDQISFRQLNYFEPNKEYRVKPVLTIIKDSSFVTILNNDGEKNKYWRYAQAVFEIGKLKDTLIIYRKASLNAEDGTYFLPFYDETNDNETYGGGRYLEIEIKDNVPVLLDFNYAYNPYCVYNHNFSCPVPPAENKLTGRIEAGEKIFNK
jgi:uncharacterized protein (DUF1684 family)